MKKISNKEYADYESYKTAVIQGRIITPDGLRIICESFNNDPQSIGNHFLNILHRFNQDKTAFPKKDDK